MPRFSSRRPVLFAALLSLAYAVAVLATLPDYGITWDEIFHYISGDLYLEYLRTNHLRIEENSNLRYYGPVLDIVGALSNEYLHVQKQWLPQDLARHLPSTLLGILVVPLVYSIVARTSSPRAALLAALAMSLNPHFFSYLHNDPKDVGITLFSTGVLWAGVHRVTGGSWIWLIVAALLFGLGFAIKLTVVVTPFILVSWCLLQHRKWEARRDRARALSQLAELAILIPTVGLLVGILCWPWLWVDPLHRVYEVFHHFLTIPWVGPVLFRGEILNTDQLGRDYALTIFTIQNPLWILFLAAVGALGVLREWGRRRLNAGQLALIGIVVILGLAVKNPGRSHDGLRQLLPALPLLSILAGMGADYLWRAARSFDRTAAAARGRSLASWGLGVVFAAGYGSALFAMVSLHPDQTAFFNWLVGGPGGADGRYEVEFYCNPYKRGMQWLDEYVEGPAIVIVPLQHYVAAYYNTPKVRALGREHGGDYYMELPRLYLEGVERPKNLEEVHRLTAGGATVLTIYRFVTLIRSEIDEPRR